MAVHTLIHLGMAMHIRIRMLVVRSTGWHLYADVHVGALFAMDISMRMHIDIGKDIRLHTGMLAGIGMHTHMRIDVNMHALMHVSMDTHMDVGLRFVTAFCAGITIRNPMGRTRAAASSCT